MKVQILRFSPHQNAKVIAILMALGSIPFVVPAFIAISFAPVGVDARGNPIELPSAWMALMFPVMYLLMGYIMVIIGCWLYNVITKYIGGLEYEIRDT
jgi:hypothetical protein